MGTEQELESGFVAGTLVHTKEGLKPIEQIKVGDWVLSQPEETGEKAFKRVTKTTCFEDEPVWTLTYYSKAEMEKAYEARRLMPSDASRRLVVTPNHPFWVKGKGWVQVQDLDLDDELELCDGQSAVLGEVYPLYRSDTPGVAWLEGGGLDSDNGNLIDLREGASETVDLPQGVVKPEFVERAEDASYFRCSVYTFEVEDYHTYFVGSLPVWVQN